MQLCHSRLFGSTSQSLPYSIITTFPRLAYLAEAYRCSFSVDCSVLRGSVLGPRCFVSYTQKTLFHCRIDMPCGHTSTPMTLSSMIVIFVNLPTRTLCARLSRCADDVSTWCKSRRLQLNTNKTEAIWFGSQENLARLNSLDLSIRVGSSTVQLSTVVRDLGLHLDNELSMKQHVTQGPICRGVGGFNPPNDFFDPRVSVDLSSWGVDSNPSDSVTC